MCQLKAIASTLSMLLQCGPLIGAQMEHRFLWPKRSVMSRTEVRAEERGVAVHGLEYLFLTYLQASDRRNAICGGALNRRHYCALGARVV